MGDITISLRPTELERATLHVVQSILAKVNLLMSQLDDLKTKVASNGTVIASAVTLIQGLKASLDAAIASGDPAQLQALSDQLGQQDQALADAVTANTPAAPAATP